MNTKTFNENFEVDRKARAGVRANPKHLKLVEAPKLLTADGALYDPGQTYYFFDVQGAEIRQSIGLKRNGEYLCTFGLKVVPVSKLRANRGDALADGQEHFKSEIERLKGEIQKFELEKPQEKRSLKSFLMTKE